MRFLKFTLVELLLVGVILMMLASFVLPGLMKSRNQARRTNCLSNLNQLGIAARLYSDEQKYYPDAFIQGPGTERYYWCAFINGSSIDFSKAIMSDYVKNPNLYICPEFELMSNVTSMAPPIPSTCSYGINAEYVGGTPNPNAAPTENDILNSSPAKLVEIKTPAKTMLFMDSATAGTSTPMAESYYFWARNSFVTGVQHESRSHFRHLRFANGVFCDGHAEDNILPEAIDSSESKIGWPDLEKCERE
ncbi:MAG TPA: hypothetical protein DET40_05240 [Lentisphaeria bacterium]|nr:MAG: hypothetical protein A2X45_20465 [Lentisphaerae bacterium GWF2_50_93]HCE42931.1 hypothetical protein [Lentisphaeria bacterium]